MDISKLKNKRDDNDHSPSQLPDGEEIILGKYRAVTKNGRTRFYEL